MEWIFRVRNKLLLISLSIRVTWLRLNSRRVEMLKRELLIYTFFILLGGIGLGMAWRAHQVEPPLRAKVATLEREGRVAADFCIDL